MRSIELAGLLQTVPISLRRSKMCAKVGKTAILGSRWLKSRKPLPSGCGTLLWSTYAPSFSKSSAMVAAEATSSNRLVGQKALSAGASIYCQAWAKQTACRRIAGLRAPKVPPDLLGSWRQPAATCAAVAGSSAAELMHVNIVKAAAVN